MWVAAFIRGLAASAGVRLRAKETEIRAAPWALRLGKGLYFTTTCTDFVRIKEEAAALSASASGIVGLALMTYRMAHKVWVMVKDIRCKCKLGKGRRAGLAGFQSCRPRHDQGVLNLAFRTP